MSSHEAPGADGKLIRETNWLAIITGFVAAFALSYLWFGPLFGKSWAAGSHGISGPALSLWAIAWGRC
jgi:hypothetical protein